MNETPKKEPTKLPRKKASKSHCPPIGEVLAKIGSEKICKKPVPVCLQPSLRDYVRAHGGSKFVREKLIKVLRFEWLESEERKAVEEFEKAS